jgi:hypothetical protein
VQNRYTGDIGDFGKFGLLRWMARSGLSIGLNWYLVPDETRTNDGRHISYLYKDTFSEYDNELWQALQYIVDSGNRQVKALETPPILNARYYSDVLDLSKSSSAERARQRQLWHAHALEQLNLCDLVFLDPDNGLMVPSAERSMKANKFVLPQELSDYYRQGSSVVYYQHKARLSDSYYSYQFQGLTASGSFPGASGLGLKFKTTSQRYYFFIMQPLYAEKITACIKQFLETQWGEHFGLI